MKRVVLLGLIAAGMLTGCAPRNIYYFLYSPNLLWTEPVSERWVPVVHRSLPLAFELPDNAVHEPDYSFGGPCPLSGRDERWIREDEWGLRLLYRGAEYSGYAVQVEARRLTDQYQNLTREAIDQLARNIESPGSALAFYHAVYVGSMGCANIRLEARGPVQISGLPAQRLRVYQHAQEPKRSIDTPEPPMVYDVTLVPRAPSEVFVITAGLDPESTREEREQIYPRILSSMRFTD